MNEDTPFHSPLHVFPNYDPRSQLAEIRNLFSILQLWENEQSTDIERFRPANDYQDGTDLMYQSVYRDAAISMAMVGALAPFVEGLLVHMFALLEKAKRGNTSESQHERWKCANASAWEPHTYYDAKSRRIQKDITRGTLQLMDALEIRRRFPANLHEVIEALFHYRNKMFHNGTEWPVDERMKFKEAIKQKKWEQWFAVATEGDEPWCFYMTQDMISTCIETAKAMMTAFENLLDV